MSPRESEPFYGEPTDLSQLFAELDLIHSVKDGHEGEKAVLCTQGDSVGTNTDNDVQVQVQQPIVGKIQAGSLQVPVQNRWPENLKVYSRRQPQVQGEQQDSRWLENIRVYSRRQPHVQGEQQESNDTSIDTVDLPIALRKGTREAAMKGEVERKALCEMHAQQTIFDGHDIGNFVSYESLSPSYRAFVASLQTVSIPKDWKIAKQDLKWREAMIEELEH
jgi:hypothetical protein